MIQFRRHLVTGLIFRQIVGTQTKAFPSSVLAQGHSAGQLHSITNDASGIILIPELTYPGYDEEGVVIK